jgi:hypothetical protein
MREKRNHRQINECSACSRRDFLARSGGGIGGLALAYLLGVDGLLQPAHADNRLTNPLAPRSGHHAPRVKRVISVFLYGGVSHVDTFDPKPALVKYHGETIDAGKTKGKLETFAGAPGPLLKSPWEFRKHGESGIEVSDLFPHLARHVDKMAVVRSMVAESNNHAPALFQMNTGSILTGRPSTGSWVTYGLGTENQNLPAFMVIVDPRGGPIGGAPNWGSGFLPAAFQGTPLRSQGTPIVDLDPPAGVHPEQARRNRSLIDRLNRMHLERHAGDEQLSARIATYELAARMQMHAPEAVDLSLESEATKQMYGLDQEVTAPFGRQCLLARRLVERGVRFVQIYSGGGHNDDNWDAHGDMMRNHGLHAKESDQPVAALLQDLQQRGLLDETLVIWHSEFGRTPTSQNANGRDHHHYAFTLWMAGGGIKGGTIYGASDEIGWAATENVTTVYDLHATVLHLLGIDHTRLTYYYNGREQRLTDVHGELMQGILA